MLQGVIRLFETVIRLMKSNGYNIAAVRQLNVGNSNVKNNKMILSSIEPVYNAYCSYLRLGKCFRNISCKCQIKIL